MRQFKRIIATVLLATALALLCASSALATSPWWGLTSGSWPTNLHSGAATGEVQQITAFPGTFFGSKGILFELKVGGKSVGFFATEEIASGLGVPEATAENIEKALEGEEFYGKGNVTVSGGMTGGVVSLVIRNVKKGPVPALEVVNNTQPPGTADANVVTQGLPDGKMIVTAENLGDAPIDGSATPVVIEDTLPEHVEAVAVEAIAGPRSGERAPVVCAVVSAHHVQCVFEGVLRAYELIEIRIAVMVAGASSGEANAVTVSGGGAKVARLSKPISAGATNGFGVADYQMIAEEEGGAASTQAGVHPFQLTTITTLDTSEAAPSAFDQQPAAMAKDLTLQLPPGLIGNPTPLPQCTDLQFTTLERVGGHNECEAKTAIGVATITFNVPGLGLSTSSTPVFNLAPLAGEPARFGFEIGNVPTFIDTSVRAGSDYGVTVKVSNITEVPGFVSSKVVFWGVPGDPTHDNSRGWTCIEEEVAGCSATVSKPPPFLSLPTSCNGPMRTTVQADSWQEPHPSHPSEAPLFAEYGMGALDGCNRLQFDPEISVAPDVPNASTTTGLEVRVHVPQGSVLNAEGLAESTLRNTTVLLPPGVAVNPGGADGLEACSEDQVGFAGFNEFNPAFETGVATAVFTPTLAQPFCPDASKIGTVEIETPLLPNTLKGAVYLATPAPNGAEEPGRNPFDSLLALYIVTEDPVSGVLVKLAGTVSLDPVTGQLLATFKNTPPVPFENLRMHFFGESRAPLGTPALCGAYTTQAVFAPWSDSPPSSVSSSFGITSGPDGSPCANPLPFNPGLTAGMTSIQAGGFSPFTMTMSRSDGNQNLKAITLKMPPGLLGTLANTKLCPEAQANAGSCPAESLIGETVVSVGLGGNPYTVRGGRVYITEGYGGAPYGLSIVNPAKAGPFDLGQVVVRAKIEVDQATAALTVTTDTTGPYKIPTILDGIPLQIQHVNVTINRPGFTFNPTNCSSLQITGSLTSDQDATSTLHVPFQATNCAVLAFKPKLTAKTIGKTSRARGASLSVKLSYPAGPYDANIARVKVDLPKQLPSRLTTLQKACPAKTFEANPAACPAASIVGHAKATTPVLPVGLEGPAYFVSHGGEAFPSLIIVLQGYGTTVHLVGTTFINKAGITSSTFKNVPDVPVGTFELTLPQGKYSALAANGNLCTTKKLAMPTSFIAQNGAEIHTSTPITPTGCTKKRAKKTGKHHKQRPARG